MGSSHSFPVDLLKSMGIPMILFGSFCYLLYTTTKTKNLISLEKENFLGLSQQEAEKRSSCISKLKYDLLINLTPDFYHGIINIRFHLSFKSYLRIDVAVTQVLSLSINGKFPSEDFKEIQGDECILIPENYLNEGLNNVLIFFTNSYTNTGKALHSMIDVDGRQYIYSNLEPDLCHNIFPCFDQPDLKAPLELIVIGPKHWQVISNENISSKSEHDLQKLPLIFLECNKQPIIYDFFSKITLNSEEKYIWKFPETAPISPYLYAIIAGDYERIIYENSQIPLDIYFRKSKRPYIEKATEQIFSITLQGLAFFQEYFSLPYPFKKYSQIFCPDVFNHAMENPGAITFDDNRYFSEVFDPFIETNRALVILHEMAHSWFGNLVTMKWWNDIWINENLAEFFAYYVMCKLHSDFPFMNPQILFHINKEDGYCQDRSENSHPILQYIKMAQDARTIFDGITYCKGSAFIFQLLKCLGEEKFRSALTHFLKLFQWQNATYKDFVLSFQHFCTPEEHIESYFEDWLKYPSFNECELVWNGIKLEVLQKPILEKFGILRNHYLEICFFLNDGNFETRKVKILKKEKTVLEFEGIDLIVCEAILLNSDDSGFIKSVIDLKSLRFFKENLMKIKDDLKRLMIWRVFYDMTLDLKLQSKEFFDLIEKYITQESPDNIWILLKFCSKIINESRHPESNEYFYERGLRIVKSVIDKKNHKSLLAKNIIMFCNNEKDLCEATGYLLGEKDGANSVIQNISLSSKNLCKLIEKILMSQKISTSKKKLLLEKFPLKIQNSKSLTAKIKNLY